MVRKTNNPVGEFCSESFLVDEAQLPASIHDIFYLHITEQTSMGAMTIFACRERHENEVLTKQVAELHLTRISTLPKFRPKHRRRCRRRGETRTPLLHHHPDASSLFRNFHPVKRHSRAFRNSWRPDEITTTVLEDTIGRPPSNIFIPSRGKGEGQSDFLPRGGEIISRG